MCAHRLNCYLAGGTPAGALRTYSGCRDRRPPLRSTGYEFVGGVYFATDSATWGGGRAFYDPELIGTVAGHAYLITSGQFADITAQEMYGVPGQDVDLRPVLTTGRWELGPGRYETLLHLGDLDGHPLLTFTAPWHAADIPWTVPSASYLRVLAAGLQEAHGWDVQRVAGYLAGSPGARGYWTPADLTALLT
ncbi:MAG: histone deacetylase [Actinomycetota bacterium]|nr:histone deacetylase [Actinomycetota bacterium]